MGQATQNGARAIRGMGLIYSLISIVVTLAMETLLAQTILRSYIYALSNSQIKQRQRDTIVCMRRVRLQRIWMLHKSRETMELLMFVGVWEIVCGTAQQDSFL